MVFVEGKLRSWGRAEMVVTILDNEVTKSETPLECTLEDIIEAVRNCGDKKSSLIYLTQECGICYSKYPMSKVCQYFALSLLTQKLLDILLTKDMNLDYRVCSKEM